MLAQCDVLLYKAKENGRARSESALNGLALTAYSFELKARFKAYIHPIYALLIKP